MKTRKVLLQDLENLKSKYLRLLDILKPCVDCKWFFNSSNCFNCRQDIWKEKRKLK